MENEHQEEGYDAYVVVMCTSGVTANNINWRVLSRPIRNEVDADFECRYHQSLHPTKKVFLIKQKLDQAYW